MGSTFSEDILSAVYKYPAYGTERFSTFFSWDVIHNGEQKGITFESVAFGEGLKELYKYAEVNVPVCDNLLQAIRLNRIKLI